MFAEKSFLCQALGLSINHCVAQLANMYHQYFGLNESPFSISVNPRYLFMSPRHRDALAHLLYGVGSSGGFILLTGEVGTGKTTINRCLLEQLPDTTDLAIVLNPALSAIELLATVCDEFGIEYPTATDSLKVLTDALHRFLLTNHAAGRKSVLMIDEAQHLDFDVLEQIRLLTNLETNEQKLLQIILIGQPELSAKLARSELRQLNQRITARYDLQPLSEEETGAYVQHRLQVAGISPSRSLFSSSVIREVHRHSRGIPRRINVLCERILLGAYGQQTQTISRRLVRSAASEVFGQEAQTANDKRGFSRVAPGLAATILVVALLVALLAGPSGPFDGFQGAITPAPSLVIQPPDVEGKLGIDATANRSGSKGDPDYVLPPELASEWFWKLHSDVAPEAGHCPQTIASPWLCERNRARVWNELADLERPVVLGVETQARFKAAIIVLEFSGTSATVMTSHGLVSETLESLARDWDGSYYYLWLPPNGWSGAVSEGAEGDAVAEIAQLFAAIDGQPRALTDTVFDAQLSQRVRLFQDEQGLEVSGQVDAKTLLALRGLRAREPQSSEWLARARLLRRGK